MVPGAGNNRKTKHLTKIITKCGTMDARQTENQATMPIEPIQRLWQDLQDVEILFLPQEEEQQVMALRPQRKLHLIHQAAVAEQEVAAVVVENKWFMGDRKWNF